MKKYESEAMQRRSRKNGAPDVLPKKALQSGCELGNVPLDIMFQIMGHLGWAGSVCLGLTCSQMYEIYKRLYPLKISLREWIETCPPPLCREPQEPVQVQLFQLLETWHGHRYSSRFLRKSVYDITPLDNSPEIIARNNKLRYSLWRSYQDYFWFKNPRINQKNIDDSLIASPPGRLSREDDLKFAFRMHSLPNPYNMGVKRWENKAIKVILSTIDVARDRRHWRWYWKNCLLFRQYYASFQKAWAERQAEIGSRALSEWLLMIGI